MTSKNSFDQSKFEISNQYLILRKFYRNLQRINSKRFVIMDLYLDAIASLDWEYESLGATIIQYKVLLNFFVFSFLNKIFLYILITLFENSQCEYSKDCKKHCVCVSDLTLDTPGQIMAIKLTSLELSWVSNKIFPYQYEILACENVKMIGN